MNTMNSCNFVANVMKDQIVVNELMTTKEVMKNRIGVASTASRRLPSQAEGEGKLRKGITIVKYSK